MIINWGDAPFKAFITVTYPSGTCTVTNGNKTYIHSGGGTHTFVVQQKGTYTVKAVNGSLSDSDSVSISKRGQTGSVSLSYTLYLIKAGVPQISFSGSYRQMGSYIYIVSGRTAVTYAYANISAYKSYGFKKIHCDGYTWHDGGGTFNADGYRTRCGIGSSYDTLTKIAVLPQSRGTVSLDISGLNLSTYPIVSLKSGGTVLDDKAYYANGYIYNLYMTT